MTTLTIKFRAKLTGAVDREFNIRDGYKVPALQAHHLTFSTSDTFAILFQQSLVRRPELTRPRLDRIGVKLPSAVFPGDEGWTIKPVGNGFMADVSLTVEY